MTYVQVEQNLQKHPKTRHLARLIGQHPRYAVGLLHEVWDWALDAKPDGMIGEVPRETIETVFGFRKDLIAVLAEAGFVCSERCLSAGLPSDVHRTGRLHDWFEYSGKLVERRLSDRLRKEHDRSSHFRPVDKCPKCYPLSSGQAHRASTNGGINRSTSVGRPSDEASLSIRSVPSVPSVPTPKPPRGGDGQDPADQVISQAAEPWRTALGVLRREFTEGGKAGSFALFFAGSELDVSGHEATVRLPSDMAFEHVREYSVAMRAALSLALEDPDVVVRLEVRDASSEAAS